MINRLEPKANLFLSNLPKTSSREQIEDLCEQFGQIFSLKFIQNESETRNQAFVQYHSIEEANNALMMLEGKELDGVTLSVDVASKENMLYFKGNVPKEEKEKLREKLMEVFKNYGDVTVGEFQFNQEGDKYFTTARLSTAKKAKEFLAFFHENLSKGELITAMSQHTGKDDILGEFKKQKNNLFCKVCPIRADTQLDLVVQQVRQSGIKGLKSFNKFDRNGQCGVNFVFQNTQDLYSFIVLVQQKRSPLQPFILSSFPTVEYPHFIVKVLKQNKRKMQQQRMMQFPFQFMPMNQYQMNQYAMQMQQMQYMQQ
jgi:hypothetical protein